MFEDLGKAALYTVGIVASLWSSHNEQKEKEKERKRQELIQSIKDKLEDQAKNNAKEIADFVKKGNFLILDSNVWMTHYTQSSGLYDFLDKIISALKNNMMSYYMFDFQLSEIKNKESDSKSGGNAREGMRNIQRLQKKYENIVIIEGEKKRNVFFDDFVVNLVKQKKYNKVLVITYDKELVIRLNGIRILSDSVVCLDHSDVEDFFSVNPLDDNSSFNTEINTNINLKKLSLK